MKATNQLASIRPLYIAQNVVHTIRYYKEFLGFEVQFQNSEKDPFFAMMGRDGISIMFKQVSNNVPPISNTARDEELPWDAYWSVEDPDAFFEEIKEYEEVKICRPVEETSYGCRDFIFEDLNGYRFCCGAVINGGA